MGVRPVRCRGRGTVRRPSADQPRPFGGASERRRSFSFTSSATVPAGAACSGSGAWDHRPHDTASVSLAIKERGTRAPVGQGSIESGRGRHGGGEHDVGVGAAKGNGNGDGVVMGVQRSGAWVEGRAAAPARRETDGLLPCSRR